MPPYPKAKNDVPKLTIKKDKPPVGMIEKDGPIADSPVAIDFEGWRPEGSAQDVRVFVFAFDPLHIVIAIVLTVFLFPRSNRTFLV